MRGFLPWMTVLAFKLLKKHPMILVALKNAPKATNSQFDLP